MIPAVAQQRPSRLQKGTAERSRNGLLTVLLVAYLVEGVLGGGGRLVVIGPVTLRMVLFAGAVLAAATVALYRQRVDHDAFWWTLGFAGVVAVGTFVGALGEASTRAIAADVTPLLSFLALPFFLLTIRDASDVRLVSAVVRWSSLLLALVAVGVFAALWSGALPFPAAYAVTTPTGEFFWRGTSTFFYKGFIYMVVGAGFFLSHRGPVRYVAIGLFLAVTVLSGTRGLLLAVAAVVAVYASLVRRSWVLVGVQALALAVAVFVLADDYALLADARAESDAVRVVQAREVAEAVTAPSFWVGHGFGRGVPSRPERMELTYLEVFHKQGVVGLLFWTGALAFVLTLYRRARAAGAWREAAPFLLAVVAVYAQSLTNPFLNNPIGITVLLVSIASLRALGPPRLTRSQRSPSAL